MSKSIFGVSYHTYKTNDSEKDSSQQRDDVEEHIRREGTDLPKAETSEKESKKAQSDDELNSSRSDVLLSR